MVAQSILTAPAPALRRRDFMALGAAAGMTLAFAPGARAASPQQGGAVRVQMALGALSDPMLATRSQMTNFTRGWLEYLVEYRADGALHPRLARGWEISADARTITLFLRDGVLWSDGTPFRAEDVAYNLQRWCNAGVAGNSMAARMAALIDPASGRAREGATRILDPLTLELQLARPDVTFIAGLSDYPAAIVPQGFDAAQMLSDPVGTGPYFPQHYTPGQSATLLRRDEHWWGKGSGAWLDEIRYLDIGAAPARIAEAAREGRIDLTDDTPAELRPALDALGWQTSALASAATISARFNRADPIYADARVREALTLACDNHVVLELGLSGRGAVGENHHVWPGYSDYAALPAPPLHDPARARALIAEAGLADHEFELISLDDDWQALSADAIAVQALDAGIKVRRKRLPVDQFWAGWRDHPWSVTEWNMRPMAIQSLALAFHSRSAWNDSHLRDPVIDELIDKAHGLSDPLARRPVLSRLQKRLQEEFVTIQPFWRDLARHSAPGIWGTEVHPTFEHHHDRWWRDPPLDPDAPAE